MANRMLGGPSPQYRGTKRYLPPRKAFNKALAMDPEIQFELELLTESLAFQARNHLADHFETGQAEIVSSKHPNGIDFLVTLQDNGPNPNAMAIEFGHWTRDNKSTGARGTYVEGLNILGSLVGGTAFKPRGKGWGRA